MDKQCEIEISRRLGVLPVKINSSLVSGQSRLRIYWTNVPGTGADLFGDKIEQPEDKNIMLKDILQSEVDEKYYLTVKAEKYVKARILENEKWCNLNPEKSRAIQEGYANRWNGTFISGELFNINPSGNGESGRVYHTANKSRCLLANGGGGGAKTGLYLISDQFINKNQNGAGFKENPEKSYTLNTVDRQSLVIDLDKYRVRKLTPTECCRLQTVPDNFFDGSGLSDNQMYSCLGDGWTVDVVVHILKGLTV
jgi:DNA (cytosine-5)-methyltransferase 3A